MAMCPVGRGGGHWERPGSTLSKGGSAAFTEDPLIHSYLGTSGLACAPLCTQDERPGWLLGMDGLPYCPHDALTLLEAISVKLAS